MTSIFLAMLLMFPAEVGSMRRPEGPLRSSLDLHGMLATHVYLKPDFNAMSLGSKREESIAGHLGQVPPRRRRAGRRPRKRVAALPGFGRLGFWVLIWLWAAGCSIQLSGVTREGSPMDDSFSTVDTDGSRDIHSAELEVGMHGMQLNSATLEDSPRDEGFYFGERAEEERLARGEHPPGKSRPCSPRRTAA